MEHGSVKDYGVFIGRFEPFHIGHKAVVEVALKENNKLIILVGSAKTTLGKKNPFNFAERKEMIEDALFEYSDRIMILPLRDSRYNDDQWVVSVQNIISRIAKDDSVRLYGHFKDDSSYYLKYFPQFELAAQPNFFGADATSARISMFEGTTDWKRLVPEVNHRFIYNFLKSERFQNIKKDYDFCKRYKSEKEWANFPPVFVTTDAVVTQSGHVLVIERKINPGKGLFALPGGFLQADKEIYDSALKELYEETNIPLDKQKLKAALADSHVFAHPNRGVNDRGRTVTHAFYFRLPGGGALPVVKGDDDAKEAFWMPMADLAEHEDRFYEDHFAIIQHFISRA
jgi:bifunctional NMN adenylyltransferase/nudix hydrolase